MTAILLFVPLLSGYLFVTSWQLTKYRAVREDSQRLYFLAAFYGIFVAICAFLIGMWLLARGAATIERLGSLTLDLAPLSLFTADAGAPPPKPLDAGLTVVFLATALLCGCTLGMMLNGLTRGAIALARWLARRAPADGRVGRLALDFARIIDPVLLAIRYRGDDIEHLLIRSVERTMPVQVSLQNRKVYVGDVVELVEPRDERKTLRLLPMLSGYRDETDHALVFTTSYTEIYARALATAAASDGSPPLTIADLEIVVQLRDVVSINLFDFDTYLHFAQPEEPATAATDDPPPPGGL